MAAHAATTLTASIDRTAIKMDEHVVFTLALINSDTRLRAEGLSPNVDLSVLSPDFDTGIPRATNRFNLSRHEGDQGNRAISSITVELFPKRTGRFTLPAFQVDGHRSNPVVINVNPAIATDTPEVFIRSGVNTTCMDALVSREAGCQKRQNTAWAREQTLVYLELLHRVNLSTASLGGDIQTSPTRIELLDYRKLPQTERKEQIAGITYNVQRMAWALFPTQSGNLTVRLPDIWAITEKGRRLRLPGKQHPIQIKALPASVSADLLVGKPEINQSPLTALPDINSLTSWNITLRAPVMDHMLPATLPGLTASAQLKLYLDNAQRHTEENLDGLISTANYTVSVTPLAAGDYAMPTIRIPYFDPLRGIVDQVELPGQILTVTAGPPQPAAPAATLSINPQPAAPAVSPALSWTWAWAWKIAAIIFAALWFVTSLLWLRARALPSATNTREKMIRHKTTTAQPESPALRPLQTRLLEAFGSHSLEQGLNAWENSHGIDEELRKTVRAVQRLYYGKEKIDDVHLQQAVHTAVTKIHAAPQQPPSSSANTWLPESFTPRI